ncbi:MAG: hypothetical protein HYR84_09590 [Planctomycetes bacterium]|nr:hypothetical protein [Planctomycetota bacterium]
MAFCLLPVGILSFMFLPDIISRKLPETRVAEKPAPKRPPEKKTAPPSQEDADAKKVDGEEIDAKRPEPKPAEPKVAEPRAPVKPKERAKKPDEEKNIDDAKKPEPKPIPPVQRRGYANLPLLRDDAIKIDGGLSDWKNIPAVTLTAVERGRPTKPVVVAPELRKAKAYLAYCSKGILVAVDVVDTSGAIENVAKPASGIWPFWDNDAVEIFVDTLNTRAHQRGEPNAHQFFAFPFGTPGDMGVAGYESRILKKNGRDDWRIVPLPIAGKNVMQRAAKTTPAGWTMEILIPKSELRHGDLKPGQLLGFELQIDTGTNIYYFWASDDPLVRVSTNPSLWGDVMLAGTDATVEVLGVGKKVAKTVNPGQPLTIRVNDLDRNLDSAKKEHVNVTLVSRSGDRKTVLLEETGADTGVFEGSIATRLRTGKREDRVLEVLADDMIAIEYLDTFRGKSERNVLVRSSVPVQKR